MKAQSSNIKLGTKIRIELLELYAKYCYNLYSHIFIFYYNLF